MGIFSVTDEGEKWENFYLLRVIRICESFDPSISFLEIYPKK